MNIFAACLQKFGKVFWDYSGISFNLGGRINLLYCLFWGVAAVVWLKALYPRAARLISAIVRKTGWLLTLCLAALMAFDIFVSALALIRYDTRAKGNEASFEWERTMDRLFDDERMRRIYPNAISQ